MSATYSTSPELHLPIAESRYPRLLAAIFLCLQLAGLGLLARSEAWLWMLAVSGLLALLLAPCGGLLLTASSFTRRADRPAAPRSLHWRQGRWWLESAGHRRGIVPLRWHCLPWCTYLAWREDGGGRGEVWLFQDSAPRDDLRRLRVRLTLQRGV